MPKKAKKPAKSKVTRPSTTKFWLSATVLFVLSIMLLCMTLALRRQHDELGSFRATPFNKVQPLIRPNIKPAGLVSPTNIRTAYGLTSAPAGSGTIAIIDAFDDPTAESDLGVFDRQFGLASCTTANGCFEKHKMRSSLRTSPGWVVESALDVQWAHAIAPGAKILLVEADSDSGTDLMNAVNYARNRSDVVAVSMSWGGNEFSSERLYEGNFTSPFGATFFAASGDSGHGTSWPAVSANIVGVGGTSLTFDAHGNVTGETAWSGSGGGLSAYISEPAVQSNYGIALAAGKRVVPDVSYNADPASGYAVYDSTSYFGSKGWFQVGGTSAGAPQWAALRAISGGVNLTKLYQDSKANSALYFRDIISGSNGSCGTLCHAGAGYDMVTGLGSPITKSF